VKFNQALKNLRKNRALETAQLIASNNNYVWNEEIEVVFTACCNNPGRATEVGVKPM